MDQSHGTKGARNVSILRWIRGRSWRHLTFGSTSFLPFTQVRPYSSVNFDFWFPFEDPYRKNTRTKKNNMAAVRKPMHILLTGTAGILGSHTLKYLVARGHTVTALDRKPLPHASISALHPHREAFESITCDLIDYKQFEDILKSTKPDGVIHLAAIPNPEKDDPRDVHNTNVVSSYNVLQTSAALGIKRIVQASSVNAVGLAYTPDGHHFFHELPVTEKTPKFPVRSI